MEYEKLIHLRDEFTKDIEDIARSIAEKQREIKQSEQELETLRSHSDQAERAFELAQHELSTLITQTMQEYKAFREQVQGQIKGLVQMHEDYDRRLRQQGEGQK